MALKRPGVPSNGTPSSRARGRMVAGAGAGGCSWLDPDAAIASIIAAAKVVLNRTAVRRYGTAHRRGTRSKEDSVAKGEGQRS